VRPAGVRGRRLALCFNRLVRADAVSRSARPVRGSKSAGFARERRAEPRKDACLPFSPRGSNSTVMKGQRSAPTSLLLFYDASFAFLFFERNDASFATRKRSITCDQILPCKVVPRPQKKCVHYKIPAERSMCGRWDW
jgi:hypothetical protein